MKIEIKITTESRELHRDRIAIVFSVSSVPAAVNILPPLSQA